MRGYFTDSIAGHYSLQVLNGIVHKEILIENVGTLGLYKIACATATVVIQLVFCASVTECDCLIITT